MIKIKLSSKNKMLFQLSMLFNTIKLTFSFYTLKLNTTRIQRNGAIKHCGCKVDMPFLMSSFFIYLLFYSRKQSKEREEKTTIAQHNNAAVQRAKNGKKRFALHDKARIHRRVVGCS
jgi:hypothetical protein